MLFTILLAPITWILRLIFGAFPTLAVPSNVVSALSSAGHSLWALNSFIPLNTFATVVGIYISVEVAILVFKFLQFIIRYIPFIGGR